MAILLVTYNINTDLCDQEALLASLEDYPHCQLAKNCFAVETTESPKQIFENLGQHLSPQDSIYIVSLKRPYYGHGPMELNDWLKERLAP